MLSMLKLTRTDTHENVFIPADDVRRLEPKTEPHELGSVVFTTDGSKFQVNESANDIVQGINHAIGWKETRVVQAQLEAAAHIEKKASGLVMARPNIDLNGN
jgi:hypothetical protein